MRRLDIFQENHGNSLIVGPGNTISQTFIPTKNNLAGVRIPVSNPKLGATDEYQMSIVYENNILREQTITGANLGWQTTLRYDFPLISDSAGKIYTLSFSYLGKNSADEDILTKINTGFWDTQKPDEKTTEIIENTQKNYVHVAYSKSDEYKNGQAMLNNQSLTGDLSFETYYQVVGISYFKDTVNDLKLRSVKDPLFFIFYFLFIGSIIGLLIFRLKIKNRK